MAPKKATDKKATSGDKKAGAKAAASGDKKGSSSGKKAKSDDTGEGSGPVRLLS